MFGKLKKDFEKHDLSREYVIINSREVVRLSKKIISAIHRDDNPDKYIKEIKAKLKDIETKKEFANTGSYSMAVQEYVEAILLVEYAKSGKVMAYEDFKVTPDEYIMGLCDFVGELQRRAVLKASKGDKETIKQIHEDVVKIYDALLDFSFRGEVRKKFDLVKYVMLRLEDLMLEIK